MSQIVFHLPYFPPAVLKETPSVDQENFFTVLTESRPIFMREGKNSNGGQKINGHLTSPVDAQHFRRAEGRKDQPGCL